MVKNSIKTQIWSNSKTVDLSDRLVESFILSLNYPKGRMRTSYIPQEIYADDSDTGSITPFLYGHHMIDMERAEVLKFKGCCWDGEKFNLTKYDIIMRFCL